MSQQSVSSPPQLNTEILEERWLHAVMVFFQSFAYRATAFNWAILVLLLSLVYLLWQFIAPASAVWGIIILIDVLLLDLFLLWLLPRQQISFGPIASQFVVMLLPRLGVTGLAMLVSAWQPTAGLLAMLILQLAGTATYVWGMLSEPHRLALTTLTVTSPHLPADAPPIKLLHLSDIHLERLTGREEKLLSLIKQANPDLIVITGDYLNLSYNNDPTAIKQVRALLPKIKAPFGVYGVLGSPPVDLPEIAAHHFDGTHLKMLRHNSVAVDLGEGRKLTLLGMDCSHDMAYDGYQFEQLYQQRLEDGGPTIFLYHSPELMPQVQNYEVDLFLCGHTHGGQVRIPFYGAILTSASTGKRYEMGRYTENNTTLYVSRGIGLEGLSAPRLRLFCPPEITLVYLTGK